MENNSAQKEFLMVYDAHADALFRHCFFRVSSREIALDLTQEAFMKTWEYIGSGKSVSNMRAFLYKVIGNLIIDHYRKHKTESLDDKLDQGIQFGGGETPLDEAEMRGMVRAIEKLPEAYREIMLLRYVNDLSPARIGEMLGQSENSVSVRLHRGVEKLREILHI